jgi:uncharacterized repeat protein (TIGR02543 family)
MKKKLILILIAVMATSSAVFYYSYENHEYTLSFETVGGIEVTSLFFMANEEIVLPDDPTKDGFIFCGWYVDEEKNQYFDSSIMPRSDLKLYADWGTEELVFKLSNGKYTVAGLTQPIPNVVIPKRYQGLPVSSIGYNAFYLYGYLKSIVIPDSITSIGDYAFMYSGLESCFIPNSVISIGKYAFALNSYLTTFTFEEGSQLEVIQEYFLFQASMLQSIEIPKSVTTIERIAFAMLPSLTSLTFEEGSQRIEIGENAFAMLSAV